MGKILAPVNSPRGGENGYEEGFERGAKPKATEQRSPPVNKEPRERHLAGFLRFRVDWQGVTRISAVRESPENAARARLGALPVALAREPLRFSG